MAPLQLIPIVHCITARAHLAGAEAAELERRAKRLRAEAEQLDAAAKQARKRYFRELESSDILLKQTPSPFTKLGA